MSVLRAKAHRETLARTPLRALRVDEPSSYAWHALLSPGGTPDDKHFLPRILGLATTLEARGVMGLDVESIVTTLERLDGLESPLVLPPDAVVAWCGRALARLGVEASADLRTGLSRAVRKALAHVDATAGDGVLMLPMAAEVAGVSPSRLTHLFTREVGIPFRRYVLWWRMRRAAESLHDGRSLTEAALAAGFADAAHFSRTFKAMFGMPPSALLAATDLVTSAWHAGDDAARPQRSSGPATSGPR